MVPAPVPVPLQVTWVGGLVSEEGGWTCENEGGGRDAACRVTDWGEDTTEKVIGRGQLQEWTKPSMGMGGGRWHENEGGHRRICVCTHGTRPVPAVRLPTRSIVSQCVQGQAAFVFARRWV